MAFVAVGAAVEAAHAPLAVLARLRGRARSSSACASCPPAQPDRVAADALGAAAPDGARDLARARGHRLRGRRSAPGVSGIATTYPLITTTLAVFVHRAAGAEAAIAVYRGLLLGMFALTAFAATLVLVLTRLPLGAAFLLALVLTATAQLGSLPVVRRAQA